MPSYDEMSGLLGIAACATNDGRFMAWSTWANEEAKNASIDKFNQALAGAAEMLDGQEVIEGPMVCWTAVYCSIKRWRRWIFC